MRIEDVFHNIPTLETERLILRKMTMEDQHDLFEYASDPELTKYTIWDYHRTMEDSIYYLQHVLTQYENAQVTNWGIILKSNQKLIGTCGFVYWAPEHHRAEVGYALSRKYWKRGMMSEAIQEVISFGFDNMDLNRIEARCNTGNIGSERIMQKCGMTFEGIIREQLLIKGQFEDIKLYAVLKKDLNHALLRGDI
ncbi:MAG: GNAT family N-acetyltransferase [Paenibacillaceae bacterium]